MINPQPLKPCFPISVLETTIKGETNIPSMAKIILHECKPPKLSSFRIADASSPPNAPAKAAEMMNRDTRNVNSL